MRETISLTREERKKLYVIQKVVNGFYTIKEAADLLELSNRQVLRLKAQYLLEGDRSVVHKNTGRKPMHALSNDLKRRILELYQSDSYNGSNDCHFAELLNEYEGINISPSSVRRILREAQISPVRKRRSKKVYRPRQRKPRLGMLLQLDASDHDWLERRSDPFSLLATIDDATSKVISAIFRPTEDLEGYLKLMDQVIKTEGIPEGIYSDKHTIFRSPKEGLTIEQELNGEETPLSQFGKAMDDLGIAHFKANTPQAKGRIERLWETFQNRLPIEFRIRKINTIEEANAVLPELVKKYNESFAKEPADLTSAFVPYNHRLPLENILCFRRGTRSIGSGQTISYKGSRYKTTNEAKIFSIKSRVEIRETLQGELFIFFEDQCYMLKKVDKESPTIASKKPETVCVTPHKPAPNHPWRQSYPTKERVSVK
jgi:transposase